MKKRDLLVVMLISVLTPLYGSEGEEVIDTIEQGARTISNRIHTDFRKLDFINKIDGKKGLFDAKMYHDTLLSLHAVYTIRDGVFDKATNQRNGLYILNGEKVTARHIAIEEQKLLKAKGDMPQEQWNILWKAVKDVLQVAKNDLYSKMKTLRASVDNNPIAKSFKQKMIAYFMETQNIPHSHLKNADAPHEKDLLDAMSAFEFFRFTEELKHFFEDLCESCTEARKQYQALVKRR